MTSLGDLGNEVMNEIVDDITYLDSFIKRNDMHVQMDHATRDSK